MFSSRSWPFVSQHCIRINVFLAVGLLLFCAIFFSSLTSILPFHIATLLTYNLALPSKVVIDFLLIYLLFFLTKKLSFFKLNFYLSTKSLYLLAKSLFFNKIFISSYLKLYLLAKLLFFLDKMFISRQNFLNFMLNFYIFAKPLHLDKKYIPW